MFTTYGISRGRPKKPEPFTPLKIMPRCSLRARGPLGRRLQRGLMPPLEFLTGFIHIDVKGKMGL
jgi:hypothetical protein